MKHLKMFCKSIVRGKNAVIFASFLAVMTIVFAALQISTVAAMLAVLTVVFAVCALIVKMRESKKLNSSAQTGLLSGMTLDFVMNVGFPVLIVDNSGSIIWHNKSALEIVDAKPNAYGKKIVEAVSNEFSDDTISYLRSGNSLTLEINNGYYDVKAYKMGNLGTGHSILVFENKSELVNVKSELKKKNVIVAYVVIDNFAEATQFVQDKYRTSLAMIGGVLDTWCSSIGGIMRESEKDKYMIVFEEQYLDGIVREKFEILDSIRNINIEGIDTPFTASIGVSRINGSFSEKEKTARQALDLALQRGGDQAVLKTEKNTEIYGGRFKSVQKRSKIRSRIIADELITLIKNSGNVLIQGHRFADHDCIASCIGVAKLVSHAGKTPKIIVNINDVNLKPIFAMMQNSNEYEDMFVDALEAQNMIRSDTLNIVCDVNNPVQFEAPSVYENAASTVIIDHHRKTGDFVITPKISYIEPSASSASELVCEMLEQIIEPGGLKQIEADLLFAGMLLDTKQFSKNTGVRTFGAALYLRGEGAEPMVAQQLLRSDIDEFKRQLLFEAGAENYKKGVIISCYDGECSIADKILIAKAADRLLGIAHTRATFVMCPIGDDIHISARSDGTVNVQLILESIGGGGHYDAAGAQLSETTIDDAKNLLCEAIDEYLSDN